MVDGAKKPAPTVICAGLITVDFLFDLPALPAEGSKNRALASEMVAGGGALYAATVAARLGGHAILAGAVGDDALGRFVRAELKRLGVDDRLVRTLEGVPTARSAVLITEGGERTIVNHRDARLFETTPAPPGSFDAVLADTRWPQGAAALFQAARRDGKPAVLDAEAPVSHAGAALAMATHIIFSEQGLADFAEAPTVDALPGLAARYEAWVGATCGGDPVLFHDGEGLSRIPAFKATPVNTLGAGDAWHGAFALALAQGFSAREAVIRANAAAAVWISSADRNAAAFAEAVEALLA